MVVTQNLKVMTEQEFNRMMKTSAKGVSVKTEIILPVKKKKSNRGNVRTEVDGVLFDSKLEAERYIHLKVLLVGGAISDLKWGVYFELNAGGTHSIRYKADFTYVMDSGLVVEDVKGYDVSKGEYILTKLFKKKMLLMKQVHNIEIRIVGRK